MVQQHRGCIHPPEALTTLTASFMSKISQTLNPIATDLQVSLSESSETISGMLAPWAAPEVFPFPFLMVMASYNMLSVLGYTALTRKTLIYGLFSFVY